MKKFLRRAFIFVIPFIIWLIVESLLPCTTFTHRHSEAISFKTRIPHLTRYYPNINSSMNAVGDLCHHSNNEIIKKEIWKTDKLGFRNDEFIEQADILIIGDSFIQGSGLSQDETISNKVRSKLNNQAKVYNMASSSMSQFDEFIKNGIIKKPKLLVFSIVERNVPPKITPYKKDLRLKIRQNLKSFFYICNLNVYIDKAFRFYSIGWLRARFNNLKGKGIPALGNSKMYFLHGVNQEYEKEDMISTANVIISYKKYCDSLGVKFLFIPMPNKETVYYELVPFNKQPNYLLELDSMLHTADVKTINTLKIYNEYRIKNKSLLYHLDDTHWNSTATELIANEIVNCY